VPGGGPGGGGARARGGGGGGGGGGARCLLNEDAHRRRRCGALVWRMARHPCGLEAGVVSATQSYDPPGDPDACGGLAAACWRPRAGAAAPGGRACSWRETAPAGALPAPPRPLDHTSVPCYSLAILLGPKMATDLAALTLSKQLKELTKNPVEGFSAGLVDDGSVFEWQLTIIGPQDTL